MAITILRNQPIDFNIETEESINCGCGTKAFCQIIDPTDATQFQIGSTDLVTNGDFVTGGSSWETPDELEIIVEITNISEEGECDGSAEVSIGNPELVFYDISLNGGTPTPVIGGGTINFNGLCEGCYFVTATDPDGNQASFDFCIVVSQCDAGDNTLDLLPFKTINIRNCNTLDFI